MKPRSTIPGRTQSRGESVGISTGDPASRSRNSFARKTTGGPSFTNAPSCRENGRREIGEIFVLQNSFDKMPGTGFDHTMIGSKLAHYDITAHLGSGGFGDVYQATDTKLGRSVAIKLLPEAFSHDAERVARFQREARVLASLNHPNIAAIYGFEEGGGGEMSS